MTQRHGDFMPHHYKALPSCLEIGYNDRKGQGLFAKENISGGSYLGVSHMLMDDQQAEVLGDRVMRSVLGAFINHSDAPNCALLSDPKPGIKKFGIASHLWAIVPIEKGTELTVFYTDGYEDIINNYGIPKYLAGF